MSGVHIANTTQRNYLFIPTLFIGNTDTIHNILTAIGFFLFPEFLRMNVK